MARLPDSLFLERVLPDDVAEQIYKARPDLPRSAYEGCPTCRKERVAGFDDCGKPVYEPVSPSEEGSIFWRGEVWDCNCHDQLQRVKHYLASGLGDMFHRLRWEDWERDASLLDAARAYLDMHERFIQEGIGLVAYGGYGTGKTMLLVLILKDLMRLYGYRCYYTTFADLLNLMTEGWYDRETKARYRSKVINSQILMIDDIGKEYEGAKFAASELDSILRTRVQASRPTFLTMNFEYEDFVQAYGVAAMQLLLERGMEMRFEGESYREQQAARLLQYVETGERRPVY